MGSKLLTAIAIASLAFSACEFVPAEPRGADYVFMFLEAGPNGGSLSDDRMSTAMEGHFANMERLARAGWLLVAGPLGEPRADPAHRGVFVFDTPDPSAAEEMAWSDPAVVAGVFVYRAVPWRADALLRRVPERHRKLAEQHQGDLMATLRPYVLVSTVAGDAAEAGLADLRADGRVLVFGRCGGEWAGHALFVLDAEDAAGAQTMLAGVRAPDGAAIPWVFHPWLASTTLTALAD